MEDPYARTHAEGLYSVRVGAIVRLLSIQTETREWTSVAPHVLSVRSRIIITIVLLCKIISPYSYRVFNSIPSLEPRMLMLYRLRCD